MDNEKKNAAENVGENDQIMTDADFKEGDRISWLTENLLKNPLKIINSYGQMPGSAPIMNIIVLNILCLLAYGLVVGSFSGGIQWYLSPIKIIAGLALAVLFCFPSLYIFICLAGIDIQPGKALLVLLSSISVFSILILGFAPVAWVFSQSTSTVFFIGFFHLMFWLISTLFGMRVLFKAARSLKCRNMFYPLFWVLIFMVTSLQTMTALRPIIGTADTILPKEKMFFLHNWGKLFLETIDESKVRQQYDNK